MDKLETLIKQLREMREELNKASRDPKLAPKEVKIKQLQSQIDAGTYKPDASKIAGAMLQHPDKPLKKEELVCSENGQWDLIEKANSSIYNAGTHPMKGRESRVGNFPHYEYDTSVPHENNVKQAKAHFDKHKIKLNDAQLETHIKQSKAKAQKEEQ